MELTMENNLIRLSGTLAGRPELSHECRRERFFRFPLRVQRLSGAEDLLPVLVRESLMSARPLQEADRLSVRGEIRSFNSRLDTGARLILSVYARELRFGGEEDANQVQLSGTLCKPPVPRRTPLGREICDLMLAVNRRYGRSDYLPCICWGWQARRAAGWRVGQQLRLSGRMQSRPYLKMSDAGPEPRTAYEISAAEVEAPDPGVQDRI